MIERKHYLLNDLYEIWIHDEILYIRYLYPMVVDLELSKKMLSDRTKVAEDKAYPILGDGEVVKYWTKEAKEFHSSYEYSRLVKAFALTVRSPVISIFFNFYNRFYKGAFALEFFQNEYDALKWLEKYK